MLSVAGGALLLSMAVAVAAQCEGCRRNVDMMPTIHALTLCLTFINPDPIGCCLTIIFTSVQWSKPNICLRDDDGMELSGAY